MNGKNWLAENFEANRTHLRGVAYRMLGSRPEAEDAVQEAWLRFSRADTSDVKNVGGWLTTVVARICLDMLRARKARREEALAEEGTGETSSEATTGDDATHPEHEVLMADSVGLALLVVLETLSPAERVAFVLHDMFDLPFEEIAPIVGRTPSATRQLASRARRRVQGAPTIPPPGRTRQSEIVRAFLAASREGDFEALLALLDPEVVFRADPVAVRRGAQAEIRGAPAVAETFKGRAQGAQPALVDGEVGVAVAPGGQLRIVLRLAISNERITSITAIADPASIRQLDVEMLDV
jgi:RNA polymerase sigma-70 factor (ECF subfamily)